MAKVRDIINRIADEGPDNIPTADLVLARAYEEESLRQTNQTWGGLVGSIVRMAPAFALEFLTSGAVLKAGVKGGTKLLGLGAKEVTERALQRGGLNAVQDVATKAASKKMAVAMRMAGHGTKAATQSMDDIALGVAKESVDDIFRPLLIRAADAGGTTAGGLTSTAVNAAYTQALTAATASAKAAGELASKPGAVRTVGRFLSEYTSRGLLDHGDEIARDLPLGIRNKLREALGVALVEAPIKGALHASLDFFVANPLIAKAMGAEETITRNELMFATSPDPEIRRISRMLAFGTAWAEYASETSGRAFAAVGGVVSDVAGMTGVKAAKGTLAAVGPVSGATPQAQGSMMRRLLTSVFGTNDEIRKALSAVRSEAAEIAAQKGIAAGSREAVEEAARAHQMTFLGYVFRDKMTRLGLTPSGVTGLFEQMGYDGVLGEFMEERYNGFAQGLFETGRKGFAACRQPARRQPAPDAQRQAAGQAWGR
jgi:hypothetical protein